MQPQPDIQPRDPVTASQLHLAAMRKHDRASVLRHRGGAEWNDTPDWRFERQVIRIGLFLRERAAFSPGERIAIVSPLRIELAVAEQAALAMGAASVALDPGLSDAQLALALAQTAPKAIFVADGTVLGRLGDAARLVVCFDRPFPAEQATLWTEALDLGGTLDTPERAQSFRAQAREVRPEMPALGFFAHPGNGSAGCEFISHSELMARIRDTWASLPPRKGDVAYLAGGPATLGARIALQACLGDGFTTTALGTPGRELEEIAELHPKRIVAPPAVLEAAQRSAPPPPQRAPVRRGLVKRIAALWRREARSIRGA